MQPLKERRESGETRRSCLVSRYAVLAHPWPSVQGWLAKTSRLVPTLPYILPYIELARGHAELTLDKGEFNRST